jgi:programmed cell death 6-interacting protein
MSPLTLRCSTLQSLNLPGSIQALEAPIGLPPSLLKKAEEVKTERGPAKLRSMMQDIRRVAQMDRQILDEVRTHHRSLVYRGRSKVLTRASKAATVLDEEEAEDVSLRSQVAPERWTRPESKALNRQLRSKVDKYRSTLKAAGDSDEVVRRKYGESEADIVLLASDPVRPLSFSSLSRICANVLLFLGRS